MNFRNLYRKASAKPGKVKSDDDLAFQLIDGNGNFEDMRLEDFAGKVNLYECGRSYAVVAIMGPQSSGKSTLLNHLFHTKFKEMDDSEGRSQTTQGIWLARCPDIEPLTLVMDIEGTDGSERGEDDTAFEKRSALFALAIADIVLVNMWCHDIGREQAGSRPLLRAVFQQVMIRFCNKPRKITLMFVVRDKTRSPEKKLEAILRRDIEKIWASIQKPSESSNIPLSDFFNVAVVFLPSYELQEEEFRLKVEDLKRRFSHSTAPGGLADTRDGKEPASGFTISAKNIWQDIIDNKDLNLPAHKVLVASIRCDQITDELYDSFEVNDQDWSNLRKGAQDGFIRDFGKKVNSILHNYVSKFDKEASYFDVAVTTAKRKGLVDKLLQLVQPVYKAMLNHLRLAHLEKFTEAFDKNSDEHKIFAAVADGCIKDCLHEFDKHCEAVKIDLANWDTLKARAKLQQDMNSYIAAKREDKVASQIRRVYEPKLKQELLDSVGYLLCEETDPTWSKIRKRFESVMQSTVSRLNDTLSEFGVDEEGRKEKLESIEKYAKDVVEAKAREESGRAKEHMLRKLEKIFKSDRDWENKGEIYSAAKAAIYTPLDVLAGLAAIRLEAGDADDIREIMFAAIDGKTLNLLDSLSREEPRDVLLNFLQPWDVLAGLIGIPLGAGDADNIRKKASAAIDGITLNLPDSPSWAQVPSSRTLITPIQCKQLWQEYKTGVKDAVNKALRDLETKRKKIPCDLGSCSCCPDCCSIS